MKTLTKRVVSIAGIALALSAMAAPAVASQNAYTFTASTPPWQGAVAVGQDPKTVTGHYGVVYFSSIKANYKATAEMCNYTVVGVYGGGSSEQTDLTKYINYQIPSSLSAGANAFFRLRTNTITTESIPMTGHTSTW